MLTKHQRIICCAGEIIEGGLSLINRPICNLSLNILTGQRVDSHVTNADCCRRHPPVITSNHRAVSEEEKRHRHNVRLTRLIQHDNVKLPSAVKHGKGALSRHNPAGNSLCAGSHQIPCLGSQRFNVPAVPAADSRRNLCPPLQFLHKSAILPHAFRQSEPRAIHSEGDSLTPHYCGQLPGFFLLIRHAAGEIGFKAGIQKFPVPGLNRVHRARR